ncbi:helix-turn-helix domain-containing protein [Aeromonas sp. MaB10011B]|uniref:S24 family peptidase n=1 Tax=unclassified Aeromonas TaxID=257493 RepID=UPI001B31F274|nr:MULTISPECIES: S24 family peptidase [unclassified Aeromonas]MBP4067119.1 helix-turn-helix domain-containing protein [Aeromonas sp. MaB10011B]MBP4078517.1 helix-turn-helix domain-containing protein [Aeromonas sp. MrichA-1]
MHISDRIFSRRSALGLSKTALAKAVGVADVSVGKWESGQNQPKGRYLNDLAAALGVSVDWLLTGKEEGTMGVSEPPFPGYRNVEPAVIPQGGRVPILSYVQAGNWREICEQATGFDGNVEYVTASVDIGPRGFGLWLRGNSMTPQFNEGDLVIVDPDEQPRPGDFVVAKNGSEEATFKKYRPRGIDENGQEVFELVPLNDDYPTMHSDRQHIEIIGVMVEHRIFRKR